MRTDTRGAHGKQNNPMILLANLNKQQENKNNTIEMELYHVFMRIDNIFLVAV